MLFVNNPQLLHEPWLSPDHCIHRCVGSGMQTLRKLRRLAILAMLRVAGAQPTTASTASRPHRACGRRARVGAVPMVGAHAELREGSAEGVCLV